MYQAVQVKKGDSISFAGMFSGSRAYVAFAGGLDVPVVMGSKSTNLKLKVGGFQGRKLGAGDEIGFSAPRPVLKNMHHARGLHCHGADAPRGSGTAGRLLY